MSRPIGYHRTSLQAVHQPTHMLDTRDKVIALCNEKGCSVQEPYPGFIVAEDFASKCLDVDATRMIDEMDVAIPTVHTGQEIVPGRLQWVSGKHIDLHYRGNELKRRKCWIQDGGTDKNILIYSYTGWNNPIAFATSDWNKSTHFKPICDKYNQFADACGLDRSNHAITTAYDDKEANIGFHFDKTRTLSDRGCIAVLKIGKCARRFCLRERVIKDISEELSEKEKEKVNVLLDKEHDAMPLIFDEYVPPGTLLFMTMEANFRTQHGVPEESSTVGVSGSIVFRTVDPKKGSRSTRELKKNSEKVYKERAERAELRKEKKENPRPTKSRSTKKRKSDDRLEYNDPIFAEQSTKL